MAIHVTTGATTTLPQTNGLLIQVNAALTGTITVNDATGAIAVITNPVVGNQYLYYGLSGVPTVVTSTTCDITLSLLSNQTS